MPPEKALRIENGEVRRSGRTRRIRGDKEFSVSSSETLRDLKLKVIQLDDNSCSFFTIM